MYSQNQEEKYIVEYFGDFKGQLCSIGENDGKTFSNALALIEKDWTAVLVEPDKECVRKLRKLHKDRTGQVSVYEVAIGNENGYLPFYRSGSLLKQGDESLVSTLVPEEKNRWNNLKMEWSELVTKVQTWENFNDKLYRFKPFDFISIDAEGMDVAILRQIDLSAVKLLCVEWNSKPEIKKEIMDHCARFSMTKILHENAENLLICR